jgi:hypothetical protein
MTTTPLATRARYEKRRRHEMRNGSPRRVPALGTQRRIRALMALGWSSTALATEGGWSSNREVQNLLYARQYVYRQTARRVSELYERLCMTEGPSPVTRLHAERNGWPKPLAWDDVDTDPAPRGQRSRSYCNYDSAHILDEATVIRVLAGENLPTNRAEKTEIMRRWLASGQSERSLCEQFGWKAGRYTVRDQEAS